MPANDVAADSCGLVGTAARLYSNGSALAGMGAAAYKGYTTGHVGVSDTLAFLPAVTWGVQAMRGVRQGCFVADTEVLTGSADEPGVFSEKAIQDVQVGDLVWTRADGDPSAPLELRPVLAVEEHVVYDLQTLSVQDETGKLEELHVTDAHPFYVDGVGWRAAVTLEVGMRLVSADGHELTVVANVDELRPEGVTVYNFTVESGRTYFVEDGIGEACWVWVHNTYVKFAGEDGAVLAGRAKQLAGSLKGLENGRTIAVAKVLDLKANRVRYLVGSSTVRRLTPDVFANLKAGEKAIEELGRLHAEQKILLNLQKRYRLLGIGASNNICDECAQLLEEIAGLHVG